ncbi:hypothetical protein M409DRAFT_20050 [Zasmidium cellare ATCC 36951]|uniref:SGT1-domain-containing protein n=1 Tax=Zasmidium cellare ATCC 36951 TaxID=1080233 RepID=A0A6A6CVV9_ZASCE|nr:uncharacterized protein M409DRAFT_20050 [Zasmidium cellare ATCC 36951]KAF2169636.1 hypothetical protein M409DRAFT_20050 [Zasmidium cellare ATCC 36951]
MDDQPPDDGLKWFGEGFDGFPKRLPDDCVEYIIYVVDQKLNNTIAVRNRLNEILKAVNDLKKKHLKDYIWQRDGFELTVHPKLDLSKPDNSRPANGPSQTPPHLRGRTDFGDSVADEWIIVFLLVEISKRFRDAWIRVYDTDGEFLLIEAANSLPKWLNPDVAESRVWLNEGHLKIVPMGPEASRNLAVQEALTLIRQDQDKLLIEPAIEKEAFYRLREYPSAISSSFHHALITIPRRLAYILHRSPAFISPATESFYLRDPVSLKPLNTKDLSTLSFSPEDFVTISVKFTKVGYAQLRSQVFDPPPAWTAVIPRMQDEKVAIGMKLTCGFEMLVADPQNQDKRSVQAIKLLLEDLESGDETLPSDEEIAAWPKTQDDEKWLDIDYNDFENELSGKGGSKKNANDGGFGDQGAQENLRKMVSRFQDFLEDDEAGADGVDDLDDDDDDESGDDDADEDKEKVDTSAADEMEFEKSMNETRTMSEDHVKASGLLEEARKLALQDDEDASDFDDEEQLQKVMELMEKELKGHGALVLNGTGESKVQGKGKGPATAKTSKSEATTKPFFGPERPPGAQSNAVVKKSVRFDDGDEDDDDVGPGDGELSSDDEDYNDVDLDLAKNMLESFKGQAGMAGPAGNLMRALGVNMPRDEDGD